MKHNIPLNHLPFMASVAIASYTAVALTTNSAVRPAEAGDKVIGVSGPYDVEAGKTVDVVTAGVIPVFFSTAVVSGDLVKVSAAGQFTKATDPADAIGVAVEDCAASALGSYIRA